MANRERVGSRLGLAIAIKRAAWRQDNPHDLLGEEWRGVIRPRVLARDNYTCRHCGLVSPPRTAGKGGGYQEVHHLDDNHRNNDDGNLVTTCCLCHSYHHIGFLGLMNGGTLVWLPELAPGNLNHLQRVLWIAMSTEAQDADSEMRAVAAGGVWARLQERAMEVESRFGRGFSTPGLFANALASLTDEEYSEVSRSEGLRSGLRILHNPEVFARQIEFWRNSPAVFGRLPSGSWPAVSNSAVMRDAEFARLALAEAA